MCGRVSSAAIQAEIERFYEYLRVKSGWPRYERCWNVAPSQKQLMVAEHSGQREARYTTWGFLPVWAKAAHASDDQRTRRDGRYVADVSGMRSGIAAE